MFGRFRHFLPAAAWVLGAATVWADAGYLPLAGPVALRFRVPAPPVSVQVNAPVAPAAAPPAPILLPSPPMRVEPKETTVAPPVQPVTNGPPLEFNAREPMIGIPPPVMPEVVVSPQMLIKYFTAPPNQATNTPSERVMEPVGFTPPLMATPPPTPPAAGKPTNPIPH